MYPEKVLVEGLNYARITPEVIESEIRLVRFQPSGITNNFTPGNPVKFLLQGDGFIDPMSTYLRFTVEVNDFVPNAGGTDTIETRFLDRSAHSFINRLIVSCNGVEIERVEDYDVLSAMIQDSLYSSEQQCLHSFEGMPSQTVYLGNDITVPTGRCAELYASTTDADLEDPDLGDANTRTQFTSAFGQRTLSMLHTGGAAKGNLFRNVGEYAFYPAATSDTALNAPAASLLNGGGKVYQGSDGFHLSTFPSTYTSDNGFEDLMTYDYIGGGLPQSIISITEETTSETAGMQTTAQMQIKAQQYIQFCIPIYSSLIGVLQPQKRFIPLRALPLEVEFLLSQYALYSNYGDGTRNYQFTKIELYTNSLKFFNDIPKAVDEMVAATGIYFHLNNFYKGPIQRIGSALPGTAQINLNFNSVNSVHWVFLYSGYASNPAQRHLHFVSHQLSQAQVQNGTLYVPNDPIQSLAPLVGSSGTNIDNSHIPFVIEYLKAWNRLHEPSIDCSVLANNYCIDQLGIQSTPYSCDLLNAMHDTYSFYAPAEPVVADNNLVQSLNPLPYQLQMKLMLQMLQKQGNLGRCQYGISLEGDQMGETKTAITGRKVVLPFQIMLYGQKSQPGLNSEMYIFLRLDSVLHIQADMRVVLTR